MELRNNCLTVLFNNSMRNFDVKLNEGITWNVPFDLMDILEYLSLTLQ